LLVSVKASVARESISTNTRSLSFPKGLNIITWLNITRLRIVLEKDFLWVQTSLTLSFLKHNIMCIKLDTSALRKIFLTFTLVVSKLSVLYRGSFIDHCAYICLHVFFIVRGTWFVKHIYIVVSDCFRYASKISLNSASHLPSKRRHAELGIPTYHT
jgi:hypothetical protein